MIETLHADALEYRKEFNKAHFPDRTGLYPTKLILAYDGLEIKA